MTDTTQAALLGAGAVCGALLAILGLLAAIWKVALPWLREQIVKPVQVTRDHVANSHQTNLRADIDALAAQIAEVKTTGDDTSRAVARIGGQLDAHLISASTTDAAVHARLVALETRQENT
ncbi:hypothetical protein [Nocardioides nitrophenolicus]|uniref:hypothetical protein n=1 Tax=Nocardioides nitrophenolicus TaxID=60489 RepID=UPI0019567FD5|nr:hypothetical protein [Nocardioides nitrophenolicus]MBM7518266.1 hypothetical protein [Nocardioides nitrophenolicus]